jgi:hypothetical protein
MAKEYERSEYLKTLFQGAGSIDDMILILEDYAAELTALRDRGGFEFEPSNGPGDGRVSFHTQDPQLAKDFGFEEWPPEEDA